MYTVIGKRASSVLYRWLLSNHISGKVLIPANICESVPATYKKAGCEIVFGDIMAGTWIMEEQQIRECMNKQDIQLIHLNHTYGVDGTSVRDTIKFIKDAFPDIVLVEDCCLGVPLLEKPSKELVDVKLYSTGHTKVVNIGWGGFAYIQDKWNYEDITEMYCKQDEILFDNHVKYCHKENCKADWSVFGSHWIDFQIDMDKDSYFECLKEQLKKVKKHKNKLNEVYRNIPGSMPEGYHNWRYQLLVENQKECMEALFQNGLFCSNHYMSLGNGYFDKYSAINCDYLYRHVINLFNDFCYTEEQAILTARILEGLAKKTEEGKVWKK